MARARARPIKSGAPPSGWEGGSWVSPSPASFRDDSDTHNPLLRHCVELPTAPPPILRMIHQSTRQGIAVHIFELLSFLPVCVYAVRREEGEEQERGGRGTTKENPKMPGRRAEMRLNAEDRVETQRSQRRGGTAAARRERGKTKENPKMPA